MTQRRTLHLYLLAAVSAIYLAAIFFLGLTDNDYDWVNHAQWLPDTAGISFEKGGQLFSEPVLSAASFPGGAEDGLTVEAAITPDEAPGDSFKFILVLYGGDDSKQLLVGQWRSSLIIMNGEDYDGRRRTNKLTAVLPQQTCLLTLTSGAAGTRLYIDGDLKKEKKDLVLYFPVAGNNARLVVGNSVYGHHSWRGRIFGLALYDRAFSAEDAAAHFRKWEEERSFSFAAADSPRAAYLFGEGSGEVVHDSAGSGFDLQRPAEMTILKRDLLALPPAWSLLRRFFIEDVLINFLGFIPLGFLLTATFRQLPGLPGRYSWQLALVLGFATSLIIEVAQAWIPSRDSSLVDLITNTIGTLAGVLLIRALRRSLRRKPAPAGGAA